MNEQIEKLIDIVVADGVVTEKEKEVLYKKGTELGIDPDELEIVLESKLYQIQKDAVPTAPPLNATEQVKPKSQKKGDIKKCPSCGAPIKSFASKCSDCGHEFTNIQTLISRQKIYDELDRIEKEERGRKKSVFEKIGGEQEIIKRINSRKSSLIGLFPVPNSKEDLLDFFNLSIAESKKHGGMHDDGSLRRAWIAKSKALKSKIELDLKNDPHAILLLKEYESNRKTISLSPKKKLWIGLSVAMGLIFLVLGYLIKNESKEKELEFQRIENVEAKIEKLIENEKYDAALIQVEKISWNVEPNRNDKLAKQTKEKKESFKKTIEKLKKQNKK